MRIGGIQKTTLIDFPGQLACTVFLIGCNFRCPFCYNSELVLPERIKSRPKISARVFFNFLKQKRGLLEGVVISGGEPTINSDLPDFIKKIKKSGFLVKLDTNGSSPEMLKHLIDSGLVDYVAMDVKAPLNSGMKKYDEAAGIKADLNKIQQSVDILKRGKTDYEFRSTIIPGIHSREDIMNMAAWLRGAKAYYLQQFMSGKAIDSRFEKVKPFPKKFLLEIKEEISKFFDICELRE